MAIGGRMLRRWARLLLGLAVFALGLALMVRARLGLSPWDVLHDAIAQRTSFSFGQVVVIVSIVVVALGWALGIRPGPGTVANATLVGLLTDVFLGWRVLDHLAAGAVGPRLLATAAGVAAIAFGTAVYVGADLGAGPRDGLMLGVARVTTSTAGVARVLIEATVLVAGTVLGGTVGLGTIIFLLAIGPAINASFRLFGMEEGNSKRSHGSYRRGQI